eukprot:6177374-Pleurochrysis_carterae.AAC.1
MEACVLAITILSSSHRPHMYWKFVRIVIATIGERKEIKCDGYSSPPKLTLLAHNIKPVPRILRMRIQIEDKFIAAYNHHSLWLQLGHLTSTKP